MSEAAPPDTVRLMADVMEEVRRRRQSGELGDLEGELDRTFARFAPVDAVAGDFETVLAKLERASVIDTRPPTVSSRPGVAAAKQGVAKASGFYMRHLATQVSSLMQAVTRALSLLDERLVALEQRAPGTGDDLWGRLQPAATAPVAPAAAWADLVTRRLGTVRGRVLHAEAGDGALLAALAAAGLDVYGVDPADEMAMRASDRVPDVRTDDVVAHLGVLAPGALAGVILSGGCVECGSPRQLAALGSLAVSRLARGGVLVVISAHPGAWARSVSPVTVDLAAGRPLHPETWAAIVAALGCEPVEIHLGPGGEELRALEGDGPWIETINADLARLNAVVFGPAAYAVTAVAPR